MIMKKKGIKLKINMGSVWKADWESTERTSVESIIAMYDAGIELDVLNVWGVIKEKLQAEGVVEIQIGKKHYDLNMTFGSFESEAAGVKELLEEAIRKIKAEKQLSDVHKGTGNK